MKTKQKERSVPQIGCDIMKFQQPCVINGERRPLSHYWIIIRDFIIQRVIAGPICCLRKKQIVSPSHILQYNFVFIFFDGLEYKCMKKLDLF